MTVCAAVRHTDRSETSPARRVTAILYLNPGWEPASHGGQLCLYSAGGQGTASSAAVPGGFAAGEPAVVVAPLSSRLVVFESGIPHEVLPAHACRCTCLPAFLT
jgi:Rps23 Pro-64 3,4-dihydroxylase Tpa1-like proline 4-hydroxylase